MGAVLEGLDHRLIRLGARASRTSCGSDVRVSLNLRIVVESLKQEGGVPDEMASALPARVLSAHPLRLTLHRSGRGSMVSCV